MDKIKERAKRKLKSSGSPEPVQRRSNIADFHNSRSRRENPPESAPSLGSHHVIIIFQVVAIVLLSLVLAGCSSYSSMTGIYVLGVRYINSTGLSLNPLAQSLSVLLNDRKGSSRLEVRAGYFGMCVRQRGVIWICSRDTESLAEQVGFNNDPLNLIGTMSKFRDEVLFSGLLIMSVGIVLISIIFLGMFPKWHDKRKGRDYAFDDRPFLSQATMNAVLSCCCAAAGLTLVASLWQHVGSVGAAAMAESANYGNVKADIGNGATAMVWIGFVVVGISTALIVATKVLSKILDREIQYD